MSQPHHYARAAFYALTAFSGWVVSDSLLKLVSGEGVPQGQILIISGLSGMLVVFAISVARKTLRHLQPKNKKGLLAIGFFQWVAWVTWVAALPHLPLTSMYVVAFLTPMTVASLAALILKEHLGFRRGCAIACGFLGVVVAVNPFSLASQSGDHLFYLLVFVSMIGTAGQMLLLRAVGRTESTEAMSFYPRMVLIIGGAIYCVFLGIQAMSGWAFLAVCASGALGAIGWALMAKAYRNAPAAAVAPFHYSQIITGALLGYLIWHDVPNPWLCAGAAIIIASGIILVRHERRVSRVMMRVD